MSTKQPEALRLADWQERAASIADMGRKQDKKDKHRLTATELRRLHAANVSLTKALQYYADKQTGEPGKVGRFLDDTQIAKSAIAKHGATP